ncbi:hypothetical protein KUTeg_017883 [Tegillarca granosa]|uniref:Uncharacterized protein n=1 Tax=Tegillarca granosa TaxID=220873 RepID=A0ABQ9EL73_TEGGR|nr:hypothetical protein KUTeg_017883 [Tegillarca granosa]
MERNEAEATGSRMQRARKQTGGQKETGMSPQPTSRKGKDHKRRCPQTGGRKRQKVSVTTLPPPSSDFGSDSEVEVAPLVNEVFRRSSVHQVTQNNMAAPINSGVNTGNTSYSTVTFSPNLVNSAQLATGAQNSLDDHVPQQIRLKVWDDQFINLYSLLPDKEENTILDPDNDSSPLVILKSGQIGLGHRSSTLKKVSNIGQWTDAFILFASIYLEKYQNVQMALDVLKYCSTIRWASSKVPGPAWRQYDEQFRFRPKTFKVLVQAGLKPLAIAWDSFQSFRVQYSLFNEFPVPLDHIVQYIAYLSLKSLSYQTVKTRIAALSISHKISNSIDHTKNFLVNKLLEGLRRSGKSKDTRAPITLPILIQLPRALVCICFSSYEAKLFHAAFTLAFFGFLRVGEIALSNCKSNSSTVLSISDISIQTGILKVIIRFSKN